MLNVGQTIKGNINSCQAVAMNRARRKAVVEGTNGRILAWKKNDYAIVECWGAHALRLADWYGFTVTVLTVEDTGFDPTYTVRVNLRRVGV